MGEVEALAPQDHDPGLLGGPQHLDVEAEVLQGGLEDADRQPAGRRGGQRVADVLGHAGEALAERGDQGLAEGEGFGQWAPAVELLVAEAVADVEQCARVAAGRGQEGRQDALDRQFAELLHEQRAGLGQVETLEAVLGNREVSSGAGRRGVSRQAKTRATGRSLNWSVAAWLMTLGNHNGRRWQSLPRS